jgi:hypothetical protein
MTEVKEREAAREAAYARYREGLETGPAFATAAASFRSIRGYQPPVGRSQYAKAVGILAKMAGESDELAAIGRGCISAINLYGTPGEEAAHIYEAAARALGSGYTDVIGRAAPDASGPRSSYEKGYSLRTKIRAALYLHEAARAFVPSLGPGWALQRLAEEEHCWWGIWS